LKKEKSKKKKKRSPTLISLLKGKGKRSPETAFWLEGRTKKGEFVETPPSDNILQEEGENIRGTRRNGKKKGKRIHIRRIPPSPRRQ